MGIAMKAGATAGYDVARIRKDFPILARTVRGRPLVYLDNAATSQKPQAVIDAVSAYYRESNANVHRGIHTLSEEATAAYEGVRETVRTHLNAASTREILFVRGTTEGINLVARSFAAPRLSEGDEVLITHLEHHSNIVPWQLVCEERGAKLQVAPVTDIGEIDLDAFEGLLSDRTRIVGLNHVSNTLGTINPVKAIVAKAHARGIPVLLDGAQAVPHLRVDVRDLDCDFYAFSGHKAYGPTGIGVLYGKEAHLDRMPPYQGGGDMIRSVTFEKTTWNDLPYKFEAGTPNIAGGVGLGAALDYLNAVGTDAVAAHEAELLAHATGRIAEIDGLRMIGTAAHKAGVISFVVKEIHPHDLGTLLDGEGVAIRAGHHCTQPLMARFGVAATARASFGMYNTREEIDRFVEALRKAVDFLG